MTKRKTALITGAALRVGRALALALAETGWDIALHYHRSEKRARDLAAEIRGRGGKAYLTQADLREPEAAERIFPALARQGVTPDCLINNAAMFEKDRLADLSEERWRAQMNVNLLAPLLLTRDFTAQYCGKDGNIINITDGLLGWSMSSAFLSYTLSKQGLAQATLLLAAELGPRIRVNAIAPGATLAHARNDAADPIFAKLKRKTPLKRVSSPEEICMTVRYILSSPSVTGQVIALAGGMGMFPQH